MDPDLVEEGNTFMELFENWKKEYKVCRHTYNITRTNDNKSIFYSLKSCILPVGLQ